MPMHSPDFRHHPGQSQGNLFPQAGMRADLAHCRSLMRGGSKTFFAASMLLPSQVYVPATALYAFCRIADDAIDTLPQYGSGKLDALDALHRRLDMAYDGAPAPYAVDRAFAATVAKYNIPRLLPEALLEGFAWDAASRRYETIDDLHEYGARVAGSVGAMMALLMGTATPDALARATDLGLAMQLTNICRDVGEDASAGRLYLPLRWMRDEGLDPADFLANPRFCPALGRVIQRLLKEADRLYHRAAAGIASLPVACRPGIHAARVMYADIGRRVEQQGWDSVSQRARTSSLRKLALLPRVAAQSLNGASRDPSPAEPQAGYLVHAALQAAPRRATRPQSGWGVDDRIGYVVALFQKLAQPRDFPAA